jgi:hypothetical protein
VSNSSQALGKYVGSLLEPLYAAKRLSKDQFKAVARRAAEKVSASDFLLRTGTGAGLGLLLESGLAIRRRDLAECAVREHLC